MEVHHHPHVENKSFKEYLLEGLMIFLAVSMGFIAENIREYINNHETERKNMEIMVSNFKLDTANLALVINNAFSRSKALDSIELIRYQNSLTLSLTIVKYNSKRRVPSRETLRRREYFPECFLQ